MMTPSLTRAEAEGQSMLEVECLALDHTAELRLIAMASAPADGERGR
jgi:hypothetical protein